MPCFGQGDRQGGTGLTGAENKGIVVVWVRDGGFE